MKNSVGRSVQRWVPFATAVVVSAFHISLLAQNAPALESEFDPKVKAQDLIEQAKAAYEKLTDYTATFVRQERIKERLLPPETFLLKFEKPFKLYMRCADTGTPRSGLELIYIRGEYKDKVLVHVPRLPDGVLPTAELDPVSPKAMENSRHPVTECGIGYFLDRYAAEFTQADLHGELRVFYNGVRQFNGRPLHEVECLLTPLEGSNYYCYRSIVYFDQQTKLPLRMLFYNWEGELLESYAYNDLRLNPSLTDQDFDPRSKAYNFGLVFASTPKGAKGLPLAGMLSGCDSYARIRLSEPVKVLIFDGTREQDYYLGYASGADEPSVAVTEIELPSWPEKKTLVIGLMREGAGFRTTAVRVTEALKPEEVRFVEQFAHKSSADPFEPKKDIQFILADERVAAEWAAAIKATVKRLEAFFSDKSMLQMTFRVEKERLPEKSGAKE